VGNPVCSFPLPTAAKLAAAMIAGLSVAALPAAAQGQSRPGYGQDGSPDGYPGVSPNQSQSPGQQPRKQDKPGAPSASKLAPDVAQAAQAFEKGCLDKLPSLPATGAGFAALGYTEKTEESQVFLRPDGGYAGVAFRPGEDLKGGEPDKKSAGKEPGKGKSGAAPKSDAPKPDGKADKQAPNACFVYVKGGESAPLVAAINSVAKRRFKKIVVKDGQAPDGKSAGKGPDTKGPDAKVQETKDFSLFIGDYLLQGTQGFSLLVSPKTEGKYAGHTLIMISQAPDADPDKAKKPLGAVIPDGALERAKLLSDLYAHLATAADEQAAAPHVEAIERLWNTPGSDTVLALMERAQVAAAGDRPDLALNLMEAVTRMAPAYPAGWLQRSSMYYALGDYERALGDLRRVLALDPNHYKAINGFAQIMRDTGDKKGAFAAYKKLIAIHPFAANAQAAHDELKREIEGTGL
jgi:hypothetical protein